MTAAEKRTRAATLAALHLAGSGLTCACGHTAYWHAARPLRRRVDEDEDVPWEHIGRCESESARKQVQCGCAAFHLPEELT